MPRVLPFLLSILSLLAVHISAQDDGAPLFGSPRKTQQKGEQPTKNKKEVAKPLTPDEILIEEMSAWPAAPALESARAFIAQGGRAVPILIENLENNDWRIRCTCAYALGELKEQAAFPHIRKATRDIANLISMGPYFEAMVKIDPVRATAEIIPYMASSDVRTADAAEKSLPEVIENSFEERLIKLTLYRTDAVRYRAMRLLPRLRREPQLATFLTLLGDRAPRVAYGAAEFLARTLRPEIYSNLQDLLLEGSLRSSCYATLALVLAEDLTNKILINDEPRVRKRLLVFLNVSGEFERAMGAIAFANISMRSDAPELRSFADGPLMTHLLGAAIGGTIFKDYISVKSLLFKKAAMLSGENLGENATSWRTWWAENAKSFRARRELRTITAADAPKMELRYARRTQNGNFRVQFRAGDPDLRRIKLIRPIYVSAADMVALRAELLRVGFFRLRGMKVDPNWIGDYTDVLVSVGEAQYQRSHYAEQPADLVQLENYLEKLARKYRWQTYWDRNNAPDFLAWFRAMRQKIAKLNADELPHALAAMALSAYDDIDLRGRLAAEDIWREVGLPWLEAHRDELLKILNPKTLRVTASIPLLRTLAGLSGSDVTDKVMAYLPLFLEDGRAAALEYLKRRDLAELVALDDEERPELRVVMVHELAQRQDDPRARAELCIYAADTDLRVTNALVDVFAGGFSQAMVKALLASAKAKAGHTQLRIIEVLGMVGGQGVVEALHKIYLTGTQSIRLSVIKALGEGGQSDSVEFLLALIQHDPDAEYRIEAMAALSRVNSDAVRAEIRKILRAENRSKRLYEYLSGSVELFRDSLAEEIGFFLSHEDPTIRKQATLLLAPRAVASTVPELLNLMLDKTEANRAWEFLELISCQEFVATSAEEAYVAYKDWFAARAGEHQTTWFMAALKAENLPADHLLSYLKGNQRDLKAVALLLKSLNSEKWYVRVNAHLLLGKVRGDVLGNLGRHSTPAEIERVKTRWAEWYKALLAGI